ncbi:MAG: SUF system NifU family Fe-S cluster assembly protein [Bacilli bacterium]|nr:SUF system NifU family Fe-S cluster assembly protein [Bacilli bacterium]MDD4076402.1 SUF system NifU family Fe-S cluster assembly protein [Bacilli bacterium]MDD4388100.1 SUF system NifU family Fe-S cluster assembly protein [Bacilli bacterium]
MNNLENLYRQVIIEHYKHPRNKGLKGFPQARLYNPSCGDDITMETKIDSGIIQEINFDGTGCSICCSSASILTELLKGKSITEAKKIIAKYYSLIKGEVIDGEEELAEAMVYQGVSKFPARIKCAALPWKALEQLLDGENNEQKS